MRKQVLFVLTFLATIPFLLGQTTRNVPTGTYPNIASAVAAAVDGDIIQIAGGMTVTESGILVNKNLTFRGGGQNSTIVQGHASPNMAPTRIFQITTGKTVRFEKMTIRHGYARTSASSGPNLP